MSIKLSKALYGFKQAPRAWYECLRDFLIANGFKVGKADPTLFTKTLANDLFVCQIYVDDIIFGSTNKSTCEEFSRIMIQKFEMSMMGEFEVFLRISSEATPRGHLSKPNEVYSRYSKQVWNEGCQAHGSKVDDRILTLFMCISTGYYAFRMHVCKIPSRP